MWDSTRDMISRAFFPWINSLQTVELYHGFNFNTNYQFLNARKIIILYLEIQTCWSFDVHFLPCRGQPNVRLYQIRAISIYERYCRVFCNNTLWPILSDDHVRLYFIGIKHFIDFVLCGLKPDILLSMQTLVQKYVYTVSFFFCSSESWKLRW